MEKKKLSHLCLFGNLGHRLDTNNGEVSLGSFTREHDTVRPVQDGICHVARLSPGRPGLLHHGLEHLGGADDGLSSTVALGDHRLLRDEHLLCWDLNPHIPTGHHQSLTASNDLGEVLDALLVLNLGNHPDVLPLLAHCQQARLRTLNACDSVKLPRGTLTESPYRTLIEPKML